MDFPALEPRLASLRARLTGRSATRVPETAGVGRAAVALVVRPRPDTLDLLLIKRAPRVGDPWSGHIALPGGKRDPRDPDTRFTAMRETLEEVGIDLETVGSYLGPLDEVQPLGAGVPALAVAPYAFGVPPETRAFASAEVASAFWVPVSTLSDPAARAEHLHPMEPGRALRFPAVRYRSHTIWGLTYRILTEFVPMVLEIEEESS